MESSLVPISVPADAMTSAFALPKLPYAYNALEPFISARTMASHYGKHQQIYVDNLNRLSMDTPWAGQQIEKIIWDTLGVVEPLSLFNNAAQVWNHTFFWQSMMPNGGGRPSGRLSQLIDLSFGSFDNFTHAFVCAAVAQFGSGWVWLVQEGDGLAIVTTANADTPFAHGGTVLLTCDLWEHAYYLDFQNRRRNFVQTFLDHLVNWKFAQAQLTSKRSGQHRLSRHATLAAYYRCGCACT